MRYDDVRELLVYQWTYTGGPNEDKASEAYHDDVLLEFPQSGERFRGKDSITAWRSRYPARLTFEPRQLRGQGDLWVAEGRMRYDAGDPIWFVKVLQSATTRWNARRSTSPTRSRPPTGAARGPRRANPSPAAATSRPSSTAGADPRRAGWAPLRGRGRSGRSRRRRSPRGRGRAGGASGVATT